MVDSALLRDALVRRSLDAAIRPLRQPAKWSATRHRAEHEASIRQALDLRLEELGEDLVGMSSDTRRELIAPIVNVCLAPYQDAFTFRHLAVGAAAIGIMIGLGWLFPYGQVAIGQLFAGATGAALWRWLYVSAGYVKKLCNSRPGLETPAGSAFQAEMAGLPAREAGTLDDPTRDGRNIQALAEVYINTSIPLLAQQSAEDAAVTLANIILRTNERYSYVNLKPDHADDLFRAIRGKLANESAYKAMERQLTEEAPVRKLRLQPLIRMLNAIMKPERWRLRRSLDAAETSSAPS
jgi:hypothetical protein